MKIISAKEAKALGLKRYFNGVPCPQGHVDERFVRTRKCCSCSKKSCLDYYYKNPGSQRNRAPTDPDKIREQHRRYYLANREKIIEQSKKRYHEKYREKYNEKRKRNTEKENERKRLYRLKNPEKLWIERKKYRDTHQEQIQKHKIRAAKGRIALEILERLGIEI